MKKTLFLLIILLSSLSGYSQTAPSDNTATIDLGTANLSPETQKKIDAAFAVADAVEKAGAYIKSLSDLFTKGIVPLPVGIKQGDYSLIVQKVTWDSKREKQIIHASCAFKFKDTGQKIAFEGEAVLEGKDGLGTAGRLELITAVRRDIGRESALIIREGTAVNFGCEGIESFEANISWITTSPNIIAVDSKGTPTGKPLQTDFKAKFRNFDDYTVSLNINQSFAIKGLKDMLFTLKGAVLDQSDTETSPLVRFPAGYFSQSDAETVQLWKGLYISEATVSLPQIFRKDSVGNQRLTVSLQETLFDENGFSGNVAVKNLLPGENISRESWNISLTDFSLGILKSKIIAFGFGGELNIPPFGKNSLRPYTATINPVTNEYDFKVGIAGTYDFPVLHSTITLNDLSHIEILFRESEIYPSIHASGSLSINAPLGSDTTKVFSVPDISFEDMVISRESPYLKIGAIGITGDLKTPKIAGFELSITNILPFSDEKGSGLSFNTGITLSSMFAGLGGVKLYGDYAQWKFKEVYIDRVNVKYESSAFSLAGGVWFKNGDAVYGNGFRGDLSLTLINKFKFDAVGIFGKKDDYRYFLTDVYFEMRPPAGIPIPPVLNFYGFGGGLYQRMQQASRMPQQTVSEADLDFGKSLSGISYLPDNKVGLGVMATTKFAFISSAELFNAKVGFEMQFNDRGGLNFVQLRGDAAFVDLPDKWGKLLDNIKARTDKLEKSGILQPQKTQKSELENAPENKSSGFLTASMNIEYDVINSTFSADLGVYLNAGIIRGIGPNDRLCWASAYFAPNSWHTYLGTPYDRLGIDVLNLVKVNGYFMLGDGIPGLPPPPDKVLRNLSAEKQEKILKRAGTDNLSMGKGMAFGAALELGFNAQLTPFYAKFGVGLGAEFMLTNLSGRTCSNYSGTPGLNGWYAQGQAWAYVEADIGLQVKVFGKRRSFSILDISLAALLEGAGPNPLYFSGNVGGRYRLLGGLVSGNCSFGFEIGDKCILSSGSPFGEDVIAQLSPDEGDKDVNVFAAPQAIFNIPVGQEMVINENDVKGTYMATLEEFSLKYKDTGRTVTGKNKISSDGTVSMFTPDEPFESQKDVEVLAKVAFKQKINNNWVYVNGDDGKPVIEDKKASFHTGDRPKVILPEHVAYSYPIDRQYNYYPKEYDKGYILLSQNYAYLFTTEKPEGFDQKLRISDGSGKTYEKPFTYNTGSSENGIRMEINFSTDQIAFEKNKIYKLAIINVPQEKKDMKSNISSVTTAAEGNSGMEITRQQATEVLTQLTEQEIYSLHFRCSAYDSFSQKVKAFDKKTEGWRDYVEPYVHYIKTNLKEPELFDAYEMQGMNNQKIVQFSAQVNQTDWYNRTFYRDMYQTQTYLKPPADKVEILTGLPDKQLTDDEMTVSAASGYNTQGIFRYAIPYWCARDFFAAKENIAQRALKGQITQQEAELLATNFPPVVFKGDYPVNASYVLPGKKITTSTVGMTMYNPVEP